MNKIKVFLLKPFKYLTINKIKEKYNNFILNNNEESVAIDQIYRHLAKYFIIISNNLDDYERGYMNKWRIYLVTLTRIALFINGIRYAISALFNSRSIRIVMSNANHLLGNDFLISILFTLVSIITFSLGITIQYQEMTNQFNVIIFFNRFQNKTIERLNVFNSKGFALKANLMNKYLIRLTFWPFVILLSITLIMPSIIMYLDPDSGFNLYSVILWAIFTLILMLQLFGTISCGYVFWYLASLYLKLKFREIYQKFHLSLKLKNKRLLMNAIIEHNIVSKYTEELNNVFKYMIFILYYLNTIFAYAGFNKVSANLQAVAIGFTNLLFTMIAMSVIDKIGRKTLLLVGSVGTALCLGGVSAIFLSGHHQSALVWLLIGFIAFFAFSQGAVIWVYLAEVFPNAVRAKGQSLGSFSHWIMNALISMVFPLMAARSGGYPFVFFSFMMVVQFFVVLFTYPETKGISLEDMQKKIGVNAAA